MHILYKIAQRYEHSFIYGSHTWYNCPFLSPLRKKKTIVSAAGGSANFPYVPSRFGIAVQNYFCPCEELIPPNIRTSSSQFLYRILPFPVKPC